MILVTGATGNVGSESVAAPARDNVSVRALVRKNRRAIAGRRGKGDRRPERPGQPAWTILRPYGFMSNTMRWLPHDAGRRDFAGVRGYSEHGDRPAEYVDAHLGLFR